MKYYLKKVLEDLDLVAKKYEAVKVDFNHPSVTLLERIQEGGHKSVIDLTGYREKEENAVKKLLERLAEPYYYEVVVDEFGDEMSVADLKKIVLKSFAKVNENDFDSFSRKPYTGLMGPIGKIPGVNAVRSKGEEPIPTDEEPL